MLGDVGICKISQVHSLGSVVHTMSHCEQNHSTVSCSSQFMKKPSLVELAVDVIVNNLQIQEHVSLHEQEQKKS